MQLADSLDIQGNILAPFNKPHQLVMFLNFRNSRKRALRWLTELVTDDVVASTQQVVQHGKDRKAGRVDNPPCWVGVSFTSSGLVTLHPELAVDLVGFDAFWLGALADRETRDGGRVASPALVGDQAESAPKSWVFGGTGPPVDVLLTLAADDHDLLEKAAGAERDRAARDGLEVLAEVYGKRLDDGKEHFGFKDGISQPGIRGFTEARVRNGRWESSNQPGSPIIATGEFVLGYEREGGSYPAENRPPAPVWMHGGSFHVVARLIQDVQGWEGQIADLGQRVGENVDVAAIAIGRKTDGRPLAPLAESTELNNFTYANDPLGETTPRCAHVRKVNPREDAVFHDRLHRLLRRGIPFEDENDGTVGLLFNAFMASIEGQFEFVLRNWASNPASRPPPSKVADGPDPVIGASDAPCVFRREGQEDVELSFRRFVHTSGAVYAFTPSIPALRKLAGSEEIPVGIG